MAADAFHIQAPDGSLVEFPAGTSDDAIKTAMSKAYPTPSAAAPELTWQDHLHNARESFHNATRALENGFSFGLADRARAGIGAMIGDGSYGDNLKQEQARSNQFRQDHPIADPLIEATGGA
jgi:hypothetical protein